MLRAMQSAVLWQKAPTLYLGLHILWFCFLVCICFAWRALLAKGVIWTERSFKRSGLIPKDRLGLSGRNILGFSPFSFLFVDHIRVSDGWKRLCK